MSPLPQVTDRQLRDTVNQLAIAEGAIMELINGMAQQGWQLPPRGLIEGINAAKLCAEVFPRALAGIKGGKEKREAALNAKAEKLRQQMNKVRRMLGQEEL